MELGLIWWEQDRVGNYEARMIWEENFAPISPFNSHPQEAPRGWFTQGQQVESPKLQRTKAANRWWINSHGLLSIHDSWCIDWSVVRALRHDALLCPDWLLSDRLHAPHPLIKERPSLSVIGCSWRRLNELDGAVEEKVAKELDC